MNNERVLVIAMLQIPDGRVFEYRYETEREYADGQEFYWQDGNMACDCNRSICLNQTHGLQLGALDASGEYALPCGLNAIRLLSLIVDGVEQLDEAEKPQHAH